MIWNAENLNFFSIWKAMGFRNGPSNGYFVFGFFFIFIFIFYQFNCLVFLDYYKILMGQL